MPALPALLIAASAGVILALGALHLLYTCRGTRFHPRDAALRERMAQVSPRISAQTTMWRAWIGFNLSHSYGAILFGLVWGHLALVQPMVLRQSPFLLALGAVLLLGYLHLGRRYWFSIPFRGIALATVLYGAGLLAWCL